MYLKILKNLTFLILVIILAIGCASVNYIGKTHPPTTEVDIYYSKEDIKKEYEVMGQALAKGGIFVSDEQIQEKLIEEAKLKGADAILITGLGSEYITTGDTSTEERQIEASFIKYK